MIQFQEQAPRRPFNFSSAKGTPASSTCVRVYMYDVYACVYTRVHIAIPIAHDTDSRSLQKCDKNMMSAI